MVVWGSLAAWLFSAPILAGHFQQLVLLGALATLFAIPISVIVLYVGLLAIAVGLIWAPLAVPLCFLARGALEVLLRINELCAQLPGAVLEDVRMSPLLMVGWYVAATAILVGRRLAPRPETAGGPRRRWILVGVVFLVGVLVFGYGLRATTDNALELHVLDVGAAQCLLICGPSGSQVMVDAGTQVTASGVTPAARRRVLQYLALAGVRRLDALIISHPHADHCNLAATVLQAVPVARLLIGPEIEPEATWQEVLAAARRAGLQPLPAQAGGRLDLGHGAVLDILEPTFLLHGTADDANNNNLVLRLSYGEVSALLPSDLQHEGEARLLTDYAARPGLLRCTVLVAAHHGSKYSNSEQLVRAVDPQVVLLSCGRGYQAPRAEGLAVFQRLGLPTWRTDQSGTIVLRTAGRRMTVTGSR
jgi:competence protein ComEC